MSHRPRQVTGISPAEAERIERAAEILDAENHFRALYPVPRSEREAWKAIDRRWWQGEHFEPRNSLS